MAFRVRYFSLVMAPQCFRADRLRGGAEFLIQRGQGQLAALCELCEFQIGRVIEGEPVRRKSSFDITERKLRELFEPFGPVSEVKLIMDRETGQSRGFGFVTMENVSEGNAAIKGLHGKDKGGRKLTVNEARPKDDRGGRSSHGSRR